MAKKSTLTNRNYNFDNNSSSEEFIHFEIGQLVEIPLSWIEIGDNIRDPETDTEIDELGATIEEYGQIQPCIVYEKDNKYIIKEGSRRFKACSQIGKETLLCIVENEFKDEKERIIKQAIENEHRKNMTAREREAYISKLSDMGLSLKDIAKVLHKSKGDVSEALKAHELRVKNDDILSKIPGIDNLSTRSTYQMKNLTPKEIEEAVQASMETVGNEKETFRKEVENKAKSKKVPVIKTEAPTEQKSQEDNFSFDIDFGNDNNNEVAESNETDIDNSNEEITFSLNYHYSINDEKKTFKLSINDEEYDSDVEKFILRQLKNYYIEKGYTIL